MSKVFTGSKAALKLNGVKVAFVAGVNVTEDNTLTDIDVLDQLEVAEHAETAHKVSFSCTMFKIDGNSAAQLGLRTENINDMLSQPELTMDIYDSVNDEITYSISGCKWEGGSGQVDARSVWNGSWNFKGRKSSGTGVTSL